MHKSLKHLIVVAGFAPLFAFAQSAGGDADKTAAIKELLTTMNVDAAIKGQGEALENGAKQEAPLVLEQALVENKSPVSYTHLTLPTNTVTCRSRWSPYH